MTRNHAHVVVTVINPRGTGFQATLRMNGEAKSYDTTQSMFKVYRWTRSAKSVSGCGVSIALQK